MGPVEASEDLVEVSEDPVEVLEDPAVEVGLLQVEAVASDCSEEAPLAALLAPSLHHLDVKNLDHLKVD